ncbi:SPOR domain-containing protein [Roseobacter sp. HKCCA2468]|uniref:SPOR domain-containing protein n=1 Tax=Roseobacter sp. HKCCA2468 TaxID=3120342 RepID=UPI0030ED9AD7
MVKKAVKFWGSMGFAATVLSSMVAVAGQGIAQNLRPPAEFPPQSFTSEQYVDSTGCAFIRTGQGASTDWIPRISRDRRQICGLPPSLSQMAAAPVAPAPVMGAAPATRPAQAPMRLREPVGVAPAAAPVMAVVPPAQSPSNNSNRCIIRARDGSVTEIRSRTAIRCGPQPIHPADGLARSEHRAPLTVPSMIAGAATGRIGATDPSGIIVPEGYRPAWSDGRLNPMRGPRSAAGDAQMAQIWDQGVPARLQNDRRGTLRFGLQNFFASLFSGGRPPVATAVAAPGPIPQVIATPQATEAPSIFVSRSTRAEPAAQPQGPVTQSSRNTPAAEAAPVSPRSGLSASEPATGQPTALPAAPVTGALVRAATYSTRNEAAQTAAQLAQFGMTARLGRMSSGYAVLVGPFSSDAATQRAALALRAAGFTSAHIQ